LDVGGTGILGMGETHFTVTKWSYPYFAMRTKCWIALESSTIMVFPQYECQQILIPPTSVRYETE
jgi:hypothetical protein